MVGSLDWTPVMDGSGYLLLPEQILIWIYIFPCLTSMLKLIMNVNITFSFIVPYTVLHLMKELAS